MYYLVLLTPNAARRLELKFVIVISVSLGTVLIQPTYRCAHRRTLSRCKSHCSSPEAKDHGEIGLGTPFLATGVQRSCCLHHDFTG